MIHPTLYKRTKTGAIQYYIVGTHAQIDGTSVIVKESGQLGTKSPVVYKEPITDGKNIGKSNETTPQQQAELQAVSDWRRKKDEGYKSLSDLLGIKNAYTNEQETPGLLEKILQSLLPKYNTDASGNVKPMLAKDWKKVKSIQYPVYIQPKLDGVRCLMIVGEDIKFLSRKGKEYTTLNHIGKDVWDKLMGLEEIPDEFILDGEIYSDELSFQEIIAAVKKQRPESLKLHFRAYDVVTNAIQEDRFYNTQHLVNNIQSPHIHLVETRRVYNELQVTEWHNTYVQQGYEGAMLRLPEGKYEQGARSSSLLKVKEFNENEFTLSGFERGQREEDLLAVCTIKGKSFRAKMIGNRKEKQELVEKYAHIHGEIKITIKHFGWTDDGLPRFPIGKAIRNYE